MAMAAALLATPFARATPRASLQPTTERSSGTRSAIDHGSRASFLLPRSSNFSSCSRGPLEPIASGLSSSGRDGGACCGISTAHSISRSTANSPRNATDFGWCICSSGLLSLNVSGLPAVRGRDRAAVPKRRLPLRISAEKPDITNVAGTLLRIGKQGLEAGTNLVPESIPRPVAQAGVGLAGLFLASFLLRSLFSTALFILAIGALSYAGYFFLTKGESSSSSSSEGGDGSSGKGKDNVDPLEEARKIMDKYK